MLLKKLLYNNPMLRDLGFEKQSEENWDYFKYVTRHKKNIISPGRQLGLSYRQLLTHDIDKYYPRRFRSYAKHFYGEGDPGWRKEVQKHYKRSPHHAHKLGKKQELKYQLEAIADWYSVGKSTNKNFPNFSNWYIKNRNKLRVSPEVKLIVDRKVGLK